jgi:hypothetical protein
MAPLIMLVIATVLFRAIGLLGLSGPEQWGLWALLRGLLDHVRRG